MIGRAHVHVHAHVLVFVKTIGSPTCVHVGLPIVRLIFGLVCAKQNYWDNSITI